MKQNAAEMMAGRIQSEELAVQHVRDSRKGMPVPNLGREKCPDQTVASHPRGDLWVFVDVFLVVVLNKGMTERLPKNNPGQSRQG